MKDSPWFRLFALAAVAGVAKALFAPDRPTPVYNTVTHVAKDAADKAVDAVTNIQPKG